MSTVDKVMHQILFYLGLRRVVRSVGARKINLIHLALLTWAQCYWSNRCIVFPPSDNSSTWSCLRRFQTSRRIWVVSCNCCPKEPKRTININAVRLLINTPWQHSGPRREMGYWGGKNLAPPHQLREWGSGVSSPSGVRDEAPAEIDFCVFLIPQIYLESNSIWFDGKKRLGRHAPYRNRYGGSYDCKVGRQSWSGRGRHKPSQQVFPAATLCPAKRQTNEFRKARHCFLSRSNKYVGLLIVRQKCTLGVSHAAPLVSHGEYADGIYRQTDGCQAVTLRFPLDAPSLIMIIVVSNTER